MKLKQNSINKKISAAFLLCIIINIFLSIISAIVLFIIQSDISTATTTIIPVLTKEKELKYEIKDHIELFQINPSSKKLTIKEKRIETLIKDIEILTLNIKSTKEAFNLNYQIKSVDNAYHDYLFQSNRIKNLRIHNKTSIISNELTKLSRLQSDIMVELDKLQTISQNFQVNSRKKLQLTIRLIVLSFIVVMIIFIITYISIWKNTLKDIKRSFKKGLEQINQLLVSKKSNTEFLDTEIIEYIDIVTSINNKLSDSNSKLIKTEKKLQTIRQNERKEISQHLHDNLGQNITALNLETKVLKNCIDTKNETARKTLDRINRNINDSIEILRELTNNLRIPNLKSNGLIKSIEKIISERNALKMIKLTFEAQNIPEDLNDTINLTVYRSVQECITNMLKHSKATEGTIQLHYLNHNLDIIIKDNGIGIENKNTKGLGLLGMYESIKKLNGTFSIDKLKKQGTIIRINIPTESNHEI